MNIITMFFKIQLIMAKAQIKWRIVCMNETKEMISLGKGNPTIKKSAKHTPSRIQADTLFTFTTELKYLLPTLKNTMISPRYCEENIEYLKIRGLKRIAYPMKCFCDINLHRLGEHLSWYGYYGLAFSKEWGMRNGIQAIQYINPKSNLRKDFSKAFTSALKVNMNKETVEQRNMKNYLLHEMMFYKPYDGKMKNRNTDKNEKKCFTDECEWRFIPDVTVVGFEQAYFDENILNAGVLQELSNALEGIERISLQFQYSDLKYIIVKDEDDFKQLVEEIKGYSVDEQIKYELISKIIIWDTSKEDF